MTIYAHPYAHSDYSLKMHTRLFLQTWGQALVCNTLSREDDPANPVWHHLPLKRSRFRPVPPVHAAYPVTQTERHILDPIEQSIAYPIVYQSALFPWLASVFPQSGGANFWEHQTIAFLSQWLKDYAQNLQLDSPQGFKPNLKLDLKLEILPQHGLKVAISGSTIVSYLRQWLQSEPTNPTTSDSRRSLPCELHYYHDRCQQLQNLALRQGWLPRPEPWSRLTWLQSFQEWWLTDLTGRSLLEAWIDQTDALLDVPLLEPPLLKTSQRLRRSIAPFLKTLAQYDRSHAWGALAHTLPPAQFWGYCALIAASDRVLTVLSQGILSQGILSQGIYPKASIPRCLSQSIFEHRSSR